MKSRFDSWLFDAYRVSADSLAVTRIVTAVCVLLVVFPIGTWIPSAPPNSYLPPPSIALFFAEPPGSTFFSVLNLLGVCAAVLVLLGAWTTLSSAALTVALLLVNTFQYSFGKIDHDILLVILPVFGAAAGWGRSFSVDQRRQASPPCVRAWPIALFALITAMVMAESGFAKLASGWLDPGRAAVRTHLVWNAETLERVTPFASAALTNRSSTAWEIADWSAVLLECGFLIAVWRRKWWEGALALACLFHLANALLFLIPYYPNVTAYALFVRWRVPARRASFFPGFQRLGGVSAAAIALLSGSLYGIAGNPFGYLASAVWRDPGWLRQSVVVVAGATVAAWWMIRHSGWWWWITRYRHQLVGRSSSRGVHSSEEPNRVV